jgi:hypothetical protein
MSSARLIGRLQAPSLHKILDDLFGGPRLVDGEERFGRILPLGITGQYPTNGQGLEAMAIPEGSSPTQLQGTFSVAKPVEGRLLSDRHRIVEHLFERREPFPNHTWSADGLFRAGRGRLMQNRVEAKRSNERDLINASVQLTQERQEKLTHPLESPTLV